MKTRLSGWGRHPFTDADVIKPLIKKDIRKDIWQNRKNSIARGLGRSYGDSALASSIISTVCLNHFLDFQEQSGRLSCSAGVSLEDILNIFVPQGRFLPVTPGTQFVTVGGAVAGDVHGKNHHTEGTFSHYVDEIEIFIPSEGLVRCSRTHNTELFRATCGGMGLTGIITEVALRLKSIVSSCIDETIIKARNLDEVVELFDTHAHATYSVAWIDCLSAGSSLGRSLLMLGEHSTEGGFLKEEKSPLTVPIDMPSAILNRYFVRAFNSIYYNRILKKKTVRHVCFKPFFYPLDAILHWNKIYGKRGFIQYQFVLPKESSASGMKTILAKIARSQKGSFLAVLKAFGKANDNYLSFPMEGLTLSLDFKIDNGLFSLLNELDSMVLDHGGRIYLAKDARMSENIFKKSYPKWEQFMNVRTSWGADKFFNSLQSKRLGL